MKYRVGDIVNGRIISLKPYGAFLALDDCSTGLLHISELSHDYIQDISSALKVNDIIQVKITSIDKEKNQIVFSRRALIKPKRITKRIDKNRINNNIMESKDGFATLAKMLPIWIKEYRG